jgi:hypothetical protein
MALSPQDLFRKDPSALWTRTEEDVLPKKIAVEEEPSLIQLRMMELRMMEAALLIQFRKNRPYPHGHAERCRQGPGLGGLFSGIVLLSHSVFVLRGPRVTFLKREDEVLDRKELRYREEELLEWHEVPQRRSLVLRRRCGTAP